MILRNPAAILSLACPSSAKNIEIGYRVIVIPMYKTMSAPEYGPDGTVMFGIMLISQIGRIRLHIPKED